MKQGFGLMVGLIVGAIGGGLFSKSMGPEPGTMEDQLEIAEEKLERAERRAQSLTKQVQREAGMRGGGMRDLARDFRDGEELSLDDVTATMKPWMRQMAPIFERLRQVNEADAADARISEWGRRYDLSKSEKEELRAWFTEQSRKNAERMTGVIMSESSGWVDLMRASDHHWGEGEGAESLMEGFLEGEERESFRAENLAKRARVVQQEADRNLQRLDDMVELDDAQHEQLFGVLVRGAEGYRPGLGPEGQVGEERALNRQERDAAIRAVLRPEQVRELDEARAARRELAESQMGRVGLVLPRDWDLLEGDWF